MHRFAVRAGLLGLCAVAASTFAHAQTYPSKPIRMLVGFPAGGPSDVPARIIGQQLQTALGQPVVVENKTGAAGMIALNEMLAQPRDGHTLLLCSYIDPTNVHLYKKAAYKIDDLAPVSMITRAYYAIVVPADSAANTIKDFITLAKARPGALNYGKVGSGSVTEIIPRQLEKDADIKMTGVTFRGTGPALQEVVAGRIDFAVSPLSLAIPLFNEKKVKIIAMTSPERLPVAPNVPTLKEGGVDIVNYGWWGVCAAAGTPRPVLDALNKHVGAAVASDQFRTTMEKTGVIPEASSVDAFGKLIVDTAADASRTIKGLGIEQLDQ
ncbi:tripartite tricarboxylate transporter substrate binding protein [Pseudorhodoplanes sp.]|uniref:Bug family tripartite tricarboxylate transporter substrate binding protein n=1 Tax=Pseudorhodoplanes sp. TaxID=1934341 RepID=UPI002BA876D5|nr:tripartite tricarboxylate transporter substrate binding protein [Pseudorhodoplanes sp.]HWV53464.1 tripartite tricarboxylate transporter substrate binding protein [Pseudorhodoplanes sp.]